MGFGKLDPTPPYLRKKTSVKNMGKRLSSDKATVLQEGESFILKMKNLLTYIFNVIIMFIFLAVLVFVFVNISNTRASTEETKQQMQTAVLVTETATPMESNLYALTIFSKPFDAKIQIMNIKPKYYPGIKLEKNRYSIRVSKAGYVTRNFYVNIHNDIFRTISLKKRSANTKNYNIYRKGNKVIYKIKDKKSCYITYNSGMFYGNTCSNHVNSKGMKIYCTRSKKVCKTANEISYALSRWL